MIQLPELTPMQRLALLEPPAGPMRAVLDTDAANEIDDQFALAYALLSPERITLEAIYATPFHNPRSIGPAEGMERSHEEILRVLDRLGGPPYTGPVLKGATHWLRGLEDPERSPAAEDLIERALTSGDAPLYVVAIGAITNVVSAMLAAPEIIEKIVIVWLGGNPSYWHRAAEFNVEQDMLASRFVFDSGAALVHVPCINVTEHLRTTQAEMERFVKGRGAIGDYLYSIYEDYYEDHYARSKELWDLGPIAWLVNPGWVDTVLVHSPILVTEQSWDHDPSRHLIREARSVQRDAIFGDLFRKLEDSGS